MKNAQEIIKKIQNLLRLSESANEHEAREAILHAQRLMLKYNLSTESVEEIPAAPTVQELCTDIGSRNNGWKRLLSVFIANNFKCETFYRASRPGVCGQRVTFIGQNADAEIALSVFNFAVAYGEARFKAFKKQAGRLDKYDQITFFTAYTQGIRDRFREEKQALEQQYGLACLDVPACVVERMTSHNCRTAPNKNVGLFSNCDAARGAGYTAGREFNRQQSVLA
ncbi:MAG: DUF2786 domain-containing protein [Cloacibacillus sp.]